VRHFSTEILYCLEAFAYLNPGELVVGEGEQETRGECQNQEQERKLRIFSRRKNTGIHTELTSSN